MVSDHAAISELARMYARTAKEGFTASARYFRALPVESWHDRTGCAEWDMRRLAGHIVGEAVWFPNLVRGVTRGEPPLPSQTYEDLNGLPPAELAARQEEAANQIAKAIGEATEDQLQQPVDMGWTKMPVWQATSVSAMEAVLHDWDTRAGREQRPVIPTAWAQVLAAMMPSFAPGVARSGEIAGAAGTYLLRVSDGVGPVTVTADDGKVTVAEGARGAPDVTLDLTADQYVRLLTGRLNLSSPEGEKVRIEGSRERAMGLNRIFAGIANG